MLQKDAANLFGVTATSVCLWMKTSSTKIPAVNDSRDFMFNEAMSC